MVRRHYNKSYYFPALLEALSTETLEGIGQKLSQLLFLQVANDRYPIQYLDYNQLFLVGGQFLFEKNEYLDAQLHFGDRTGKLFLKSSRDIWSPFFEIQHRQGESLLQLNSILEPLWRGSQLAELNVETEGDRAASSFGGPDSTHVTYFLSHNFPDYCRITFSSPGFYRELIWTRKGVITRSHPLEATSITSTPVGTFDPHLIFEAALILLGLKNEKAQQDLSLVLEDLLAQAVYAIQRKASFVAS